MEEVAKSSLSTPSAMSFLIGWEGPGRKGIGQEGPGGHEGGMMWRWDMGRACPTERVCPGEERKTMEHCVSDDLGGDGGVDGRQKGVCLLCPSSMCCPRDRGSSLKAPLSGCLLRISQPYIL